LKVPEFSDHFSGVAGEYQRFRPAYDPGLFGLLADLAPARTLAVDCGAGSGQAARGLLDHFQQVVATDASARQLLMSREPRLERICCLAEALPLADHCADLVIVAQALHWFDRERFFAETRRVLKPGGVVAAWTYQLLSINPGLDKVITRFHSQTLAGDWPPQRRLVDSGYRDIAFPFRELDVTAPAMWADWNLEELTGYLSTWSAVSCYRRRSGSDPLPAVMQELQEQWPPGAERVRVSWPVAMLAGRT
jgi:SAM-dependent methyltransferase